MFLLPSIVLMAMGLEKKKNQKKLLRKKLKFMRNFQLGSHLEGNEAIFMGWKSPSTFVCTSAIFVIFSVCFYECFAQM